MTKIVLFTATLLLVAVLCSAGMTIYFLDGRSEDVAKITFRGSVADLYLPDGSIRSVRVDKLDLKSSGIPKPEGTYGQTRLTPSTGGRKSITPPPSGDPGLRQIQLREEWEKAEQVAIAIDDVGAIRKGDEVRIVSRTSASEPYSEYAFPVETTDDAYLIIYAGPNGVLAKKLFDAATFASNFRIQTAAERMSSPLILPKVPHTQEQQQTQKEPEEQPTPEDVNTKPIVLPIIPESKETEPPQKTESKPVSTTSIVPLVLGTLTVLAAGAVVFVAVKKRKKPFVNTSRFRQIELELKDYEIEIWIKHGRNFDQLVEVCTKKFYQDQPAPLALALKLLKGIPVSEASASLMKHGIQKADAVQIVSEMEKRIQWIRETIRAVSDRAGRPIGSNEPTPQPPPAEKTPPAPQPSVVQTIATPPAVATVKQAVSSAVRSTKSDGMPLYLQNVLKQIGKL